MKSPRRPRAPRRRCPAWGVAGGKPTALDQLLSSISARVAGKNVPTYLGPAKFHETKTSERDEIGLTNGLAYTTFGGTILECEVSVVPGKGKLVITGLLEKGMQESAQAAIRDVFLERIVHARGIDDLRRRTVGREHDRPALWHFADVVNKDDASFGETLYDDLVVHNFVVAVHRRIERADHPRKSLDGHLHAGTEASG